MCVSSQSILHLTPMVLADSSSASAPCLPAVVAVGYNRPEALHRLLLALRAADLPQGVPLVISLDWSGNTEIAALAEAFEWPHGPKRVIRHESNLGLRRHILACGDLSQEYGAIALFEDDLLVNRHFYSYLCGAIAHYQDDDRIGGISLYNYKINEFNNMDFEPLDDGSDVYFLQVAASWGQAWTARQWALFRAWYETGQQEEFDVRDGIPRQLAGWRDNSWKRYYIKYLVKTNRYFVYPRASLSTNLAIPGTNTKRSVSIYQTPLDMKPRHWRFVPLDQSLACYDVFYEPLAGMLRKLQPLLNQGPYGDCDFDVDLYASKPTEVLSCPLLLSSRSSRQGLGFALQSQGPACASILAGVAGSFFHLGARSAFGKLSLRRRYALIRATQVGSPINALIFQTLKPIQIEMMIAKKARAARQISA
jgi:hypothetical protein